MTFEKDSTSNGCKSKEDEFEYFLQQEFKSSEKDYNGIYRVLNKMRDKLKKEINGKVTKED